MYALSVNFLPRLRDELLPLCMDDLANDSSVEMVYCDDSGAHIPALTINLRSRKNMQG